MTAITQEWNEANQAKYNGAVPPSPNESEYGFPTYDVESLIREEYRTADNNEIWYGKYSFLHGVIT